MFEPGGEVKVIDLTFLRALYPPNRVASHQTFTGRSQSLHQTSTGLS